MNLHGGYLLYRMWPGRRVFIDGQTDFYGSELVNEYLTALRVQDGWQDILQNMMFHGRSYQRAFPW